MFEHDFHRDVLERLDTIIGLLKKPDVARLTATVDAPIQQTGETKMAGKVAALKAIVAPPMLDDQKALVHWQALDSDGAPTSFPTGATITNALSDATATTAPAPADPTTGVVDPTAVFVVGVKGTAGTPTLTGTFTNADGSVATGTVSFTITIDPKELDVASLGATVDPAVAQ